MAVQQTRKSRRRTRNGRSHDALKASTLTVNATTGETTRRHHLSPNGFNAKGRQVIASKKTSADSDSE